VKDFRDDSVFLDDTIEHVTETAILNSAATLVPANTPVVCTRMAVGRCALTSRPTAINQDLKAFLLSRDVNMHFFIRMLRFYGPVLDRISVGSTVRGITLKDLLSLEVYHPSTIDTQARIAYVLDTIDEAIQKSEAVIAKLKQIRAGMLHDLLTYGLDKDGKLRDPITHLEQFKDSELGRIPKEWEVVSLASACVKIADRDHTTPDYVENGVKMVSPLHFVDDDEIAFERCPEITPKAHAKNRQKTDVQPGDLIIHRIGAGLGRVRLVLPNMPEFSILHSLAQIRTTSSKLSSCFLRWFFESTHLQAQIRLGIQSIGVPDLGLDKIGSLLIALPGLREQESIAQAADATALLAQSEQAELAKLTLMKAGLMNDLLNGDVHIPENVLPEGGVPA